MRDRRIWKFIVRDAAGQRGRAGWFLRELLVTARAIVARWAPAWLRRPLLREPAGVWLLMAAWLVVVSAACYVLLNVVTS